MADESTIPSTDERDPTTEEQKMKLATRFGIDQTNETALAEFKKLCMELPTTEIQGEAIVIERADNLFPPIGSWYWVPPEDVPPRRIIRNNNQWLGCVMKQGSNFVELHAPNKPNSGSAYTRVHQNDFADLIFEPNAKEYFQSRIENCKNRINAILGEIKDITARLGIVERDALPDLQDNQEEIWERKEAKKENDRISRSWRESKDGHRPTHFRPYGNEGPGYLAHMKSFSQRSKKCTFTWMRRRLTGGYYSDDDIQAKITVPLEKLFNVSAYVPGDFKMFFNDPRTRRNYLKWAPLLIAAEEFHAGSEKAQAQRPV